jgi:signal transduction histidine kinase
MGANSDNTCLPPGTVAKTATARARVPEDDPANGNGALPSELQQDYNQLSERFQRTTNALASAAHDLKTPLAILNGYVELLQSEKLGPLNEKQREVIGDMRSSGQRLQNFIQDFLSYTVLETGELRMQYESGDMNATLSEVCRLWSPRFQERGLALYFLANEKLPTFAFDSPKTQRVISNLLENASKWERRSAAKPAVERERRRQPLSVPNAVKVSVSDTGPGIPPEYHLEVFDDFFRLPGSENQSEGMGLGLAIARRLVNGMGGKVWVESEPGNGCKFSFLVPLNPSSTARQKGKTE